MGKSVQFRPPPATLTGRKRMGIDEVEELLKAIRWMAQTVHQGYHADSKNTWRECPKSICDYARQIEEEHGTK